MTPPLLVMAVMTDLQVILRLKISVVPRRNLAAAAEMIRRNALVHPHVTAIAREADTLDQRRRRQSIMMVLTMTLLAMNLLLFRTLRQLVIHLQVSFQSKSHKVVIRFLTKTTATERALAPTTKHDP